jgi:hypothetical protein
VPARKNYFSYKWGKVKHLDYADWITNKYASITSFNMEKIPLLLAEKGERERERN